MSPLQKRFSSPSTVRPTCWLRDRLQGQQDWKALAAASTPLVAAPEQVRDTHEPLQQLPLLLDCTLPCGPCSAGSNTGNLPKEGIHPADRTHRVSA